MLSSPSSEETRRIAEWSIGAIVSSAVRCCVVWCAVYDLMAVVCAKEEDVCVVVCEKW